MTTHEIIAGDCRQIVPTLGLFDLIFADPPFNIGQKYRGYNDKQHPDSFDQFTEEWIEACWNACSGVMCLHGPDDLADAYLAIARKLRMKRIAWVNWHYRFGQCSRRNWIDSRCHCLVYAKSEEHTWNPERVLVESDRSSKYGDLRINDSPNGGKRVPFTVWGIPSDGPYWSRIQGNNSERRPGCPNQLPEVYLQRLIAAYTNPGDRILDPFCGSGTTVTVAKAMGRSCVSIDVSEETCASARERLEKGAVRL